MATKAIPTFIEKKKWIAALEDSSEELKATIRYNQFTGELYSIVVRAQA